MEVAAAEGVASAAELGCVSVDDSSSPFERLARADCSHAGIARPMASDGFDESDGPGLGKVMGASDSILAAVTAGAAHS